jgi:hypothetical protein
MPDNQTQDEWLQDPRVSGDPNAKGTGVIVRTPDASKEYLDKIEYEELVEQAEKENIDTYSWVPEVIASEGDVKTASCTGLRCARGKCPPGCICSRKRGRCR